MLLFCWWETSYSSDSDTNLPSCLGVCAWACYSGQRKTVISFLRHCFSPQHSDRVSYWPKPVKWARLTADWAPGICLCLPRAGITSIHYPSRTWLFYTTLGNRIQVLFLQKPHQLSLLTRLSKFPLSDQNILCVVIAKLKILHGQYICIL